MATNNLQLVAERCAMATTNDNAFRLADLDLLIQAIEVSMRRGAFNSEEVTYLSLSITKAKKMYEGSLYVV